MYRVFTVLNYEASNLELGILRFIWSLLSSESFHNCDRITHLYIQVQVNKSERAKFTLHVENHLKILIATRFLKNWVYDDSPLL